MNKITSILILISSLFFITACSSGAGIKGIAEPPQVSVQNVQLKGLNWRGGQADFTLKVSNPNTFPLPLSGFDYRLRLNDVDVASGNREQSMTIPARQSQQVSVPLSLSFVNMASMLPSLLRQGTIQYALMGSVHLPWFKIPFKRSGTTNLRP
ncbi:MAG: Water stress and hypersensitive response domain-containing protein [Proteobacteria bacterium]|nr:MAG: Water stress and hypersensitive response domain-containing protein [Pseudomonadota bacterium]